MSNNNSNSSRACPDQDWYVSMGKQASVIVYYTIHPFCVVLAITLHVLFLNAFRRQSKKETAYVYQIYFTISQLVESLTNAFYVIALQWLASPYQGPLTWYSKCYTCIWVSAHFSTLFTTTTRTVSELFAVSMSADRVVALWKPFVYKNMNAKRNQIFTIFFCITMGITSNLAESERYTIRQISSNPSYAVTPNGEFTNGPGKPFYIFRQSVEVTGLIALYVFNTAGICLFRYRRTKAAKMMNKSRQEKKKEETERTMTFLAIVQSLFISISVTCRTVSQLVVAASPTYYSCEGQLQIPVLVALLAVLDLADMVCLIGISKKVRRMIRKTMPSKWSNTVDPVGRAG